MEKLAEQKGKRYFFECEKGRRWSSCSWPETKTTRAHGPEGKDGDTCNFSGCLPDHKIKLIRIGEIDDPQGYSWFKNWKNWKKSPVYLSLCD